MSRRVFILMSLLATLFATQSWTEFAYSDIEQLPVELPIDGDSEHEQKEESKEETKIQLSLEEWSQHHKKQLALLHSKCNSLGATGYFTQDTPPPELI